MHQAADIASSNHGAGSRCKPKYKSRHWNSECTTARDRGRFWFRIWCSMGRPKQGVEVHDAYRSAKGTFRKVCLQACNGDVRFNFSKTNVLLKNGQITSFWNKIRKSRSTCKTNNYNDISLESLEKYFTEKFSYDITTENEHVSKAREEVAQKLNECNTDQNSHEFVFTEFLMKKEMSKIRLGCFPGSDGITGEYVSYAVNSNIVLFLCQLFTVCFKSGIVPRKLKNGILIPFLKKKHSGPYCS